MKVFKFGGASVKNAEAIKEVAALLKQYAPKEVVVVVSAMGKTTNTLERVLQAWYAGNKEWTNFLVESIRFHKEIMHALFENEWHPVFAKVVDYFDQLQKRFFTEPSGNYDYDYDQVVSYGELISTVIIDEYLRLQGFDSRWFDVRKLIVTDHTWREGNVDWTATEAAIRQAAQVTFTGNNAQSILLTQGFLGGTADGKTTTLGREGSDYTAAIFSYVLNAENMTVWKDVPGVLNADPKIFTDTVLLPNISYSEAIELTYYGATIIHPKTIKPLQNKRIPLHVRSFLQPESPGTVITATADSESLLPSYIVKDGQLLASFSPKNFSFIAEQNLSDLFAAFAQAGIRVNMMQISAISFTACFTDDERRTKKLFDLLGNHFSIKYNEGLQLLTIRHWTPEAVEQMTGGKTVLLEQRNRTTVQMVLR